jgi:hypothetical protein
MSPNPYAGQCGVSRAIDRMKAGVPSDAQALIRSLADVRRIGESQGARAESDARFNLACTAICSAAKLLWPVVTKSTRPVRSTPARSRGVNAEQLGAIHRAWLASMRARGMHL